MAHSVWPDTPIFSFEPDPECFARLCETFRRHRIPGKCFQLAVGAKREERAFRLQENSAQNSFLSRKDKLGGFHGEIVVQTTTLNEVATQLPEVRRALLKIDTQGFELQVLAGASDFLTHCAYVQVEVAFRREYEGQPYAADVLAAMHGVGFGCAEILDILRQPNASGRPIAEADLLFTRMG
jgi:FkbM family methyltransferase